MFAFLIVAYLIGAIAVNPLILKIVKWIVAVPLGAFGFAVCSVILLLILDVLIKFGRGR